MSVYIVLYMASYCRKVYCVCTSVCDNVCIEGIYLWNSKLTIIVNLSYILILYVNEWLTSGEPSVFESYVTAVDPPTVRPAPWFTVTSHSIITVVSLSGVNNSTSMSVVCVSGKEMSSWNLTRLPIHNSAVFSYGATFARVNVTFCGATDCIRRNNIQNWKCKCIQV